MVCYGIFWSGQLREPKALILFTGGGKEPVKVANWNNQNISFLRQLIFFLNYPVLERRCLIQILSCTRLGQRETETALAVFRFFSFSDGSPRDTRNEGVSSRLNLLHGFSDLDFRIWNKHKIIARSYLSYIFAEWWSIPFDDVVSLEKSLKKQKITNQNWPYHILHRVERQWFLEFPVTDQITV